MALAAQQGAVTAFEQKVNDPTATSSDFASYLGGSGTGTKEATDAGQAFGLKVCFVSFLATSAP